MVHFATENRQKYKINVSDQNCNGSYMIKKYGRNNE